MDDLAKAHRHVADGEVRIERQQTLISGLERGGQARRLLAQFQELRVMHIADRDRLEKELSEPSE